MSDSSVTAIAQTKTLLADVVSSDGVTVEAAYRIESLLCVVGWSKADLTVALRESGRAMDSRVARVARHDVAQHLGVPNGEGLGFVIVSDHRPSGEVSVVLDSAQGVRVVSPAVVFRHPSVLEDPIWKSAQAVFARIARSLPSDSPLWRNLVTHAPVASFAASRGHLDGAFSLSDGSGLVWGWANQSPGEPLWVEEDTGRMHALEGGYVAFHPDIDEVIGVHPPENPSVGFFVRFCDSPAGASLRLRTLTPSGVTTIGQCVARAVSQDPVSVSRLLFGISPSPPTFVSRALSIDQPILEPLIAARNAASRLRQSSISQHGSPVVSPKASVIIPLYGRIDMVEHQMIEFCRDPWLERHADIIYVLDDPRLLSAFAAKAETIFDSYGIPFRWIWGGANRGYSGANNLGAHHARADHVVFLNSDVFPQTPGWLEALINVLLERSEIGAVAPRLVFGDGSIQHAGMEFRRVPGLHPWINHHPHMGLDPADDPHEGLTIVQAVTGACLAMRRADLERVGGWDEGYLLGDFEDSDLCLKLLREGLRSAYLPSTQLTHLERQSFHAAGDASFRSMVMLFNATRHHRRWSEFIEGEARAIWSGADRRSS